MESRVVAFLDRLREAEPVLYPRAFTRATVLSAIGRVGLEEAVARGGLVALLPGVYVAADQAEAHDVRCEAVMVWSKKAALIAGESALHLRNRAFPAPERVRAVVPPGWSTRPPAWIHLPRLPRPSAISSALGSRCLLAEDALLDAWACASSDRRKDILYRALWLKIAGPRRLVNAASRRARLPDRRTFDAIMGDFLTGATSPTEVMARREVFTGPEFAELEWQVPMVVNGRRRIPDAIHRAAKVDLECDGDADHTGPRAVARDRERNTEFAAIGWLPVRFSFKDLRDRPEWCRRMLADTIAARLERPRASP